MGPTRAIITCLLKTPVFFGRASRSEYWWFLPVGLAFPAMTFEWLRSGSEPLPMSEAFAWSCLAVLPLAAVTLRRCNDIGEGPTLFTPPAGALALLAMAWPLQATYWDWVSVMLEHGDGPGMLLVVLVLVPIAGMTLLAIIAVFVFGLFTGASLFGHMLLPSDPGTNRYGPPPEAAP